MCVSKTINPHIIDMYIYLSPSVLLHSATLVPNSNLILIWKELYFMKLNIFSELYDMCEYLLGIIRSRTRVIENYSL